MWIFFALDSYLFLLYIEQLYIKKLILRIYSNTIFVYFYNIMFFGYSYFLPSLCPLNSQYHSEYLEPHPDIESLSLHPVYSITYHDVPVLEYDTIKTFKELKNS